MTGMDPRPVETHAQARPPEPRLIPYCYPPSPKPLTSIATTLCPVCDLPLDCPSIAHDHHPITDRDAGDEQR